LLSKIREEGVLIMPLGNVIVIMPPLNINIENLNRLMDIVKRAIIAATNN
jgi:adenosylmethionine-8-amino-7-oxononanoate aminotransferase